MEAAQFHILALIEKAAKSKDSNEAMKFSQAASSAANAISVLTLLNR